MTMDIDSQCLDTFPEWLRTLGADALTVAGSLDAEGVPEEARRILAGALNYLFKSIDLIPDGIDDIGYLDDAFVLRVAAAHAVAAGHPSEGEVAALAAGAALLRDFLDADYPRLERYVAGLRKVVARGRSVDAIVQEGSTRRELVEDVSGFARGYTAPTFTRDPKTLVKLRAFFDARLPR